MRNVLIRNIFPVAVIFIIIALILPLNEFAGGVVLDFLLILSIAVSLIVVLITMYMKESLDFSIFPTMLLVLTMFRLVLNVSTTRAILSNHGDAGHVIQTFGQFVVRGNPVVGFIMFVIIVLVNFLVITKGSERVSEVAARFTLDAMPGKQMAIDADLAAGAITAEEAIDRRRKIQRESDFFGSMDGATKFVKGDAIMSIVAAFVNLIAGVVIGMVQDGGTINEVLYTYALATVGDGLCSQIPALLTSFATGMIVTRAGNAESFSMEMPRQLFQNPVALMISGATVLLLAIIPGFPKPAMFLLGGSLIWGGWYILSQQRKEEVKERYVAEQAELAAKAAEAGVDAPPGSAEDFYRDANNIFNMLPLDQIEMDFGYSLLRLVDEKSGGNFIERLVLFRKDFALQMGMVFPSVRMRNNPDINPNQYLIKIRGEEVARAEILVDHFLALDNGDVSQPVDGIDTVEPAFGIPARWISSDRKVAADVAGYTLIDPVSVMVTHLSEIVKKYSHEILTRQDVNIMVENIRKNNESLVADVIPQAVTIGYLQRVLAMLLKEGIPIRDMETILETLSENAHLRADVDMVVEQVRQGLKRTITRRFAEGNSIRVIIIDPELEDFIIKNVKKTAGSGSFVPDPKTAEKIISRTREEADKVRDVLPNVLVLTAPLVRIYFRRLIEQYVNDISVISYNELEPSINIQAVGSITLK